MEEADQRGGQIKNVFYKYFLVICPGTILVNGAISLFVNTLKYGHSNPNKLFRSFRLVWVNLSLNFIFFFKQNYFCRLPWDQNTLIGWAAETIFSFCYSVSYCLIIPSLLTFFVSICNYNHAFYEIFRHQIVNIDSAADFHPFPIDRVKKLMSKSISFHVSVKE